VTLLSQDFYTGSGSHVKDKPPPVNDGVDTLVPTTYLHGPFPQTAANAITFGPSGMNILVNQFGSLTSVDIAHSLLYLVNQNWGVSGFTTTFQVTSPESYNYTSTATGSTHYYQTTLVGSTTGEIFNVIPGNNRSGILQPDTYTYSGVSATNGPFDSIGQSFNSDIVNGSLTVTPEPAGFAVLALALTALLQRQRAVRGAIQ
jgi:hypothetical protein